MTDKLKWQNTTLEPVESFQKGEYEELLKYVEENELMLLSLFVNGQISEFKFTSKYGCSKVGYFEGFTEENPMFHAIFKLGELSGYLHALGAVEYERAHNNLEMARFLEFKTAYPNYASLSEAILKEIRKNGSSMTLEELNIHLNVKKQLIFDSLHYLCCEGFIVLYCEKKYSLSDRGIRVAKQLISDLPQQITPAECE